MLTKWVVWGLAGISLAVAGAPLDGNEACFLRRDRLRAIVGQNGLPHGFEHQTHKCALPCIEAMPQRYADPMAIFHLTHRTVGRSTHAVGTAGAHIGYITRTSACRAIITEHIPTAEPGSKGGAARAWLNAQEEADRKNARVIDKLEIALPRELDQAQRVELVRAFVQELGGGKSVGPQRSSLASGRPETSPQRP